MCACFPQLPSLFTPSTRHCTLVKAIFVNHPPAANITMTSGDCTLTSTVDVQGLPGRFRRATVVASSLPKHDHRPRKCSCQRELTERAGIFHVHSCPLRHVGVMIEPNTIPAFSTPCPTMRHKSTKLHEGSIDSL